MNDEYKPLNQFTATDIIHKINEWVTNDVNYKRNLSQTKQTFNKYELSAQSSANSMKLSVQNDLSAFITTDTLNIMFHCFEQWKDKEPDDVKSKAAEQIAHILFNYPLNNLLTRIKDENITGKQFLDSLNGKSIIQIETGWNDDEIYQIQAVLLKYHTFTQSEFNENMNNILTTNYGKSLSKEVINKVKETISEFNVEEIHFKIKNGKNIDEFSDRIINLIDELLQNKQEKKNNDDFVRRIYMAIAECFIYKQDGNGRQHWICNNCGNCNINSWIAGKLNTDLSVCILCGMQQKESMILALRKYNTFIMVREVDQNVEVVKDENSDDIDLAIQTTSKPESMQLFCPNKNDNNHCDAILRLTKMLIKYKRWIYTIYKETNGKDDIERTIKIDIAAFADNAAYKVIFTENAKLIKRLNAKQIESLLKMFRDNIDDINDVHTFLNMKRMEFAKYVEKHTGMKPRVGATLYSKMMKALKKEAQTKQYGKFLSDTDMNAVNADYYHIMCLNPIA